MISKKEEDTKAKDNNKEKNKNEGLLCPNGNTIVNNCKDKGENKVEKENKKENNKNEVKLWQSFLNKYENEHLIIDGIFGNNTEASIKRFQNKYKDYILLPWGLKAPTGYIYKSTKAYGNHLLNCSTPITIDNGKVLSF